MPAKAPIPQQPPATLAIADIYYIVFKHKWKILICSVLGLAAAVAIILTMPPPYVSEAKLMVRGLPTSKGIIKDTPLETSPDAVMGNEADILTSLDVAAAVVDVVGAEKIVGKSLGTTNREAAALVLRKQIMVNHPPRGNVLIVTMKHRNPDVVQPVLRALIDAYFRKHIDIHRTLGSVDDVLSRQTDEAKARLTATEESLRKIKADAGIISLEDAKRQVADRLSKVMEDLRNTEVELEQHKAARTQLEKQTLVDGADDVSGTNAPPLVKSKAKASPELVAKYQSLLAQLEGFRKKEQELSLNFRPESPLVKEARQNVEAIEAEKRDMLAANPSLTNEEPVAPASNGAPLKRDTRADDIASENTHITALAAKLRILQAQFEAAKTDVAKLDKVEGEIVPLERKKDLEDKNYRYYLTTLEQARFDNTLNGEQLSNIKEIQSPSLPYRDKAAAMKHAAMAAIGGIGLGFGLAFLIEMMLDQSIRKPSELEQKFHLPTFLTIPNLSNGHKAARAELNGSAVLKALPPAHANGTSDAANGSDSAATALATQAPTSIAPWDEAHQLHPYSAALRDRLVSFFELKGLTHKPKLVALTSCSPGAGVTTLAAGLAASLSETGEGNVLLVDMNIDQGAAHPFYRGKPACGLADVLEQDKRPAAKVQDKLYMVHGGSGDDRLPQILPKRISHLIPKLQASDYDYIIFDMPPVTQTSVTPRLAAFMDMVFMVVEDEKTSREWLKQASGLLVESKANLGAVYNKRRAYVPKWLHQEF